MKKLSKRLLSVLLAALLVACVSVPAFAVSPEDEMGRIQRTVEDIQESGSASPDVLTKVAASIANFWLGETLQTIAGYIEGSVQGFGKTVNALSESAQYGEQVRQFLEDPANNAEQLTEIGNILSVGPYNLANLSIVALVGTVGGAAIVVMTPVVLLFTPFVIFDALAADAIFGALGL